jgi:uncharacterized protein (TIGR03083 family)
LYAGARARLLELADDLGETVSTPVPALPGWTVRETYAHLAGVCADVLDGRGDGIPGERWTARQVAERANLTLREVTAEWAGRAPALEAALSGASGRALTPVAVDVWTHEQDILSALNRPLVATGPEPFLVADRLARSFRRGWVAGGRPAIRVVGDQTSWELGEGETIATLRASDFELARAFVGRRSRRQMLAMNWDGNPEPFIDHLHVFGPPRDDLVE